MTGRMSNIISTPAKTIPAPLLRLKRAGLDFTLGCILEKDGEKTKWDHVLERSFAARFAPICPPDYWSSLQQPTHSFTDAGRNWAIAFHEPDKVFRENFLSLQNPSRLIPDLFGES